MFVATFSGQIFYIALEYRKTVYLLHVINDMLRYLQDETQTIAFDNLRTAMTKTDLYEPLFTDLCYKISALYVKTFSASKADKLRAKAMVEKVVNLIYKYVYTQLQNQRFISL